MAGGRCLEAAATCLQPPATRLVVVGAGCGQVAGGRLLAGGGRSLQKETGGWRQVAGGRWLEAGGCRQVAGGRWLEAVVLGGGWRGAGVAGGGMLRYSAVRTGSIGSVRGRISDTSGSVSDTLRYAIKVLLKQP